MRTYLAFLVVGLLTFDEREAALPANIVVDEPLKSLVVEMLQGSRTFRRQCEQLAAVRVLRVRISPDLESRWSGRGEFNARCVIKRYEHGRVHADVRLLTLANAQTLIAHELEHVREYVEGMNFLATSVQYPKRVWMTAQGHYETTRAIHTGEQVGSEMARHRSRHATATLARRAQ